MPDGFQKFELIKRISVGLIQEIENEMFFCVFYRLTEGFFRTNLSPSLSLAHAHYITSKWRLVMSIERFSVQVCPLLRNGRRKQSLTTNEITRISVGYSQQYNYQSL